MHKHVCFSVNVPILGFVVRFICTLWVLRVCFSLCALRGTGEHQRTGALQPITQFELHWQSAHINPRPNSNNQKQLLDRSPLDV